MQRIVYADILFLINFCLDFLSLYLSGGLLHLKRKTIRLCISASLGALYAVVVYVLQTSGFFLPIHLLMSVLMVYIAYDISGIAEFVKLMLLFYAVAVIFGGGMTAIYNVVSQSDGYFAKRIADKSSPIMFFAIILTVVSLTSFAGRLFTKAVSQKIIKAKLTFGKSETELSLLCDSGNLLRDPFSSLPVIIVNSKKMSDIFPSGFDFSYGSVKSTDKLIGLKMRLVPIVTASGRSILPAIKPDKTILWDKGKNYEVEAVIALDTNCSDGFSGTDGLCPLYLLK